MFMFILMMVEEKEGFRCDFFVCFGRRGGKLEEKMANLEMGILFGVRKFREKSKMSCGNGWFGIEFLISYVSKQMKICRCGRFEDWEIRIFEIRDSEIRRCNSKNKL